MTTTHGQVKVVREASETIRGDNVCRIQRKRDNLYGCSQSKCNKANCSGRCLSNHSQRKPFCNDMLMEHKLDNIIFPQVFRIPILSFSA